MPKTAAECYPKVDWFTMVSGRQYDIYLALGQTGRVGGVGKTRFHNKHGFFQMSAKKLI
jgi:hypothetical protein